MMESRLLTVASAILSGWFNGIATGMASMAVIFMAARY
jgi:hypothetical protein